MYRKNCYSLPQYKKKCQCKVVSLKTIEINVVFNQEFSFCTNLYDTLEIQELFISSHTDSNV